MAISTTMKVGVDWLRRLSGASHNDKFAGTVFWTDAQILDVLEDFMSVQNLTLYPIDDNYLVYRFNAPPHYFLDTSTVAFDGTLIEGTVDRKKRLVTFDSALTKSTVVYMLGYHYNMFNAAEALWNEKANQRYDAISIKSGANQLQLQQEYEHCVGRAEYYERKIARSFRRKVGW